MAATLPPPPSFGDRGSRILGFGHYQPSRIMTNDELSDLVDTSDAWIQARTGIVHRHIASDEETVDFMATEAARAALLDAGVEPADISMVVVACTTSHDRSPNVAGRVAVNLGLGPVPVLELNTACSGFEYALAVADQSIKAGSARNVLVIGTDKFSSVLDWTDRTTCILMADAAGAAVIGPSEPALISPVVWGSVPHMVEAVRIDGEPTTFKQEGRSVYRWALTEAGAHARAVVETAGLSLADIDVFAFHQANLRIIKPLAKALDAEEKIVLTDVTDSGNTSAASVPLALSKAWQSGQLPENATVLLFGFGGGFTHAGQVIVTPTKNR